MQNFNNIFAFHHVYIVVEEESQSNIKRKNMVMICEDDFDLSNLLRKEIGSEYIIIAVDSGTECISRYIDEKAKGNEIDALIVDYNLHDLPGDIVATTIRDLTGSKRRINTILVSALELDRELVEDLKMRDCIIDSVIKPVTIDSLMKIIRRAIAGLSI